MSLRLNHTKQSALLRAVDHDRQNLYFSYILRDCAKTLHVYHKTHTPTTSNCFTELLPDTLKSVNSLLSQIDTLILCSASFSIYELVSSNNDHPLQYFSRSIWRFIDMNLSQICLKRGDKCTDFANNIYHVLDIANGVRVKRGKRELDLNLLLYHRYAKILKPMLNIHRLLVRTPDVMLTEYCILKEGHRRCSFGRCKGVVMLLVTSTSDSDVYSAEFIFCRKHLKQHRWDYNICCN